MRITWRDTDGGFCANVTPKHQALKGFFPPRLIRRKVESDGFKAGTWILTGPVTTNLWASTTPGDAKKAAAKMIRAYCAAMPAYAESAQKSK